MDILDIICKFNYNDCETCEFSNCPNCKMFVEKYPMRAVEYIPKSNIVDTKHLGYFAYIVQVNIGTQSLFIFNKDRVLVYKSSRNNNFSIKEVHSIIEDIDKI